MENLDNTMEIKTLNDQVTLIKNEELRNFVEFRLEKSEITKEDLLTIKDVQLNGKKITGERNIVDLNELELFPNLEYLILRDLDIESRIIDKLQNIAELELRNCKVENIKKLKNLKKLLVLNSEIEKIENLSELSELEELELADISVENYTFLSELKKLKTLKIKNVKKFSLEKIDFSLPIEYLSVEDITELNLNIISKFENLKTLSLDMNDIQNFENEVKELKKKSIKILLNDIYEY